MKPPTVWGLKGVRLVTPDHARLPTGQRLLLERELQESDDAPLYTRNGLLRIIDTGPERLLLPRTTTRNQTSFQQGSSTSVPVPTPTPTPPPPTPTPTPPPPTPTPTPPPPTPTPTPPPPTPTPTPPPPTPTPPP